MAQIGTLRKREWETKELILSVAEYRPTLREEMIDWLLGGENSEWQVERDIMMPNKYYLRRR